MLVDPFQAGQMSIPPNMRPLRWDQEAMRRHHPEYSLLELLGSGNGPASSLLAKAMGIKWKLHCVYHSQSSGQVETMIRTLKETLTLGWVSLLLLALFRIQNSPYALGLPPSEVVCAKPPPLPPHILAEVPAEFDLSSLQALFQVIIKKLQREILEPAQKGPYTLILTTPTGVPVWIRHSRVKPVDPHVDPDYYMPKANTRLWRAAAHP